MNITLADHAGFCFGVSRAVETAKKELARASEEGKKLYCLGALIHNKTVTTELEDNGLFVVNNIDDIEEGGRVLIRAHGEPVEVYEKSREKKLELIDATCPHVAKIHKLVRDAQLEDRYTVVIGDVNHPEVKGILGNTRKKLGAVYSEEDVKQLSEGNRQTPVLVVAQTTITKEKFDECVCAFNLYFDDVIVENTICNATKLRQDAAVKLAKLSDCMIVIGDKNSSNSNKLYEICKKHSSNVFFVENSNELDLQSIEKYDNIGVAASASAPERNIKEVIVKMSDTFTKTTETEEMLDMAAYMEEIEKSLKLPGRGEVVTGTVVLVAEDYIVVNLGYKKDGVMPATETALEEGQTLADAFKEGDEVTAKIVKTDDGDGNFLLSNKRLVSGENWEEIAAYVDSNEVIEVSVVKEVKGGVIASYKEVSGFIPFSQLADHYVEKADEFIGKTLPVKVTKVDAKRNKAVFSHKAFLNEEKSKKIAEIWDQLAVGDVVEGKVMRFTDYGAFVDIGGIDGLLHISEISWGKLKHPQEALELGQTVQVKILSMNTEKGKISLGMKQNNPEPWTVIEDNYEVGQLIKGKVVQIKEYGAFVELAPGLDGLVHISEIAHKRVDKIADELQLGQEVEAKILEIDKEKRRISLSIKATLPAPEVPEEAPAEAPAEAEEAPKAE